MGRRLELLRIPAVDVGRADVVIPHDDHIVARIALTVEIADQTIEPAQLVLVVLMVKRPTIGHVARRDQAPPQVARDAGILVGLAAVAETGDRILESDLRQDRHPIPSAPP